MNQIGPAPSPGKDISNFKEHLPTSERIPTRESILSKQGENKNALNPNNNRDQLSKEVLFEDLDLIPNK